MTRQGCWSMSARKLAVCAALALLGMANLVLLAGFNYNNSADQGLRPSVVFSAARSAEETHTTPSMPQLKLRSHEGGRRRKRLRPIYENYPLRVEKWEHTDDKSSMPAAAQTVVRNIGSNPQVLLDDSQIEVTFDPNGGLRTLEKTRHLSQRVKLPKPEQISKRVTNTQQTQVKDQNFFRSEDQELNSVLERKELRQYARVRLVSPSPPTAEDSTTYDDNMYEELLQPLARPELSQEKALPPPQGRYGIRDSDPANLQWDMEQCSLAMGVPGDHLRESRTAISVVAREASVFLNAVWSIVPKNFSRLYKNPCWFSNLALTMDIRGFLLVRLNSEHRNYLSSTEIFSLANKLFHRPTSGADETLLCMPYFFTAGFPKCGTSSLHVALQAHQDIARPYNKEPHWWTRIGLGGFSSDYLKLTVVRYLLNFLESGKHIMKDHNSVTYDASQSTLWDSNFFMDSQDYCVMPTIISRVLPKAKFIVLMRNPVSRLYSHFLYSCKYKFGDSMSQWPEEGIRSDPANVFHTQSLLSVKDFNSCLRNQTGSLYECVSKYRFKENTCGNVGYRLTVSLYYIHILKWMQFYPKEQFLFLRTEDLTSKPHEVMKKITKFLEIAPVPPNYAAQWLSRKVNVQNLVFTGTGDKLNMRQDTREFLEEFYRPYNIMLTEITNDRDFLWED